MHEKHNPHLPNETHENKTGKKLNIRDVAQRAGVSHQTVSRVINNSPNVSEKTRKRVQSIIESLNYIPNHNARALASSQNNKIGLLIDNPDHYGPRKMLRGFEKAAKAEGYTITIVTIDSKDDSGFYNSLNYILNQQLDGLCLVAPRINSLNKLKSTFINVPIVAIDAEPEEIITTENNNIVQVVAVDQNRGAKLATEYLMALGHTGIAHISGPIDWIDAQRRKEGWKKEILKNNLEIISLPAGDWSAKSGYLIAQQVIVNPKITAVFVANDQMALGLIHGLHKAGLSVPKDISIIGFDDTPESAYFIPPLTTIRQDLNELGKLSFQTLLDSIKNRNNSYSPKILKPELIVRESTHKIVKQ